MDIYFDRTQIDDFKPTECKRYVEFGNDQKQITVPLQGAIVQYDLSTKRLYLYVAGRQVLIEYGSFMANSKYQGLNQPMLLADYTRLQKLIFEQGDATSNA